MEPGKQQGLIVVTWLNTICPDWSPPVILLGSALLDSGGPSSRNR